MGSVLLGRTTGAAGFTRVVALKRLHPQYANDPAFVSRFKDEVRVSASVQHPNVVQTLDVVASNGDLMLVMEYIDGATLHALLEDAVRQARRLPLDVVSALVSSCLHGIHAAHEATDDEGVPLRVVHRDISPQNIMIGRDGQVKVLDFGLAQAVEQSHVSRVGLASGKAGYMSPEQVRCEPLDRRTDIFAVGIVLWETLTGQRLFRPGKVAEGVAMHNVLTKTVPAPSDLRSDVPSAVDEVALRALNRDRTVRFATAKEFALALEAALPPATASRVGSCLLELCSVRLASRAELLAAVRRGLALTADTVVGVGDGTQVQTETAVPGVAADTPDAKGQRPSGRSWKALALPALAFLSLVGIGLGTRAMSETEDSVERGVQARAQGAVSVSRASASIVAPASPPPVASPSVTALASASVSRPGLAPSPAPSSFRPKRAGGARAVQKPPRKVEACNPPTFVDQEGIRHFKEGCI